MWFHVYDVPEKAKVAQTADAVPGPLGRCGQGRREVAEVELSCALAAEGWHRCQVPANLTEPGLQRWISLRVHVRNLTST